MRYVQQWIRQFPITLCTDNCRNFSSIFKSCRYFTTRFVTTFATLQQSSSFHNWASRFGADTKNTGMIYQECFHYSIHQKEHCLCCHPCCQWVDMPEPLSEYLKMLKGLLVTYISWFFKIDYVCGYTRSVSINLTVPLGIPVIFSKICSDVLICSLFSTDQFIQHGLITRSYDQDSLSSVIILGSKTEQKCANLKSVLFVWTPWLCPCLL